METILIAGGSGTIGKHLTKKLIEIGYNVSILSRTKCKIDGAKIFLWNVEKSFIEEEAINTADYIINLSGANISEKRWSEKRKKEIINSRVQSSKLLFESSSKHGNKLKAFISASAVGIYGMETTDKIFTENDLPSKDFLGDVCNAWENECEFFEKSGIRTVKIRTGVVLNKGNGALSKMILPIKMFIGSPLGTGKQFMPWIHIDDLCNIYIKALQDKNMKGAYNAVAPEHLTNGEFTKTLANVMDKPLLLPNVPSFILKLIFGEMANIILEGSRVSSEKIIKSGYKFQFSKLEEALIQLV